MFTGLIEEVGRIKRLLPIKGGIQIEIIASKILEDLKTDHSVSVSGVCLTVIKVEKNSFVAEAVGETLEKSTIRNAKVSTLVNLERAMKLNDRLGGHLVQGHVNGVGKVVGLEQRGKNWFLVVSVPTELSKYLVPEGSIALDGMSLTIANYDNNNIGVSIIPHTYVNTTISNYRIGQEINIEVDFFAKYIEKYLANMLYTDKKDNKFSKEWFEKIGY